MIMIKMARSKDKSLELGRKTSFGRIFPFRFLAHLCLLTMCQHVPHTSCQPFLNQLAVMLRSRPAWPTSFPASSQQHNKVLMHPQNQQQFHQQYIHQGPPQHNFQHLHQMPNVYPTSSEQFQNFLASNNILMQQGPLSQGIPMVAMDPAQNSITIMTPTGPEQIVPPNPNSGGIYVAQPIQPNENVNVHNINNNNNANSSNPIIIEHGHSNNLASPQTIVQMLPNHLGVDPGQNLLDGNNMLAGVPTGSGNGNIAVAANFPNEQYQQSAGFQPSFHPQQGFQFLHSGNTNNQQVVPPPPPPPIPKNLKGPAIIAVPKPLPSQNQFTAHSFFNSVDQSFPQFVNSQSGSGSQNQPVIIQSIHQLPNMSPAYSQLQHLQQPHQQQQQQNQLISSPENAMSAANNTNGSWQSSSESQFSFSGSPLAEKSTELVGNPRNQRKRHQKKQPSTPQPKAKIIRKRPTSRPTQIPVPAATESYQNEIDSKPSNLVSDYSLSTIINLPSTTITGSFEYPDPPTPPNFESMNALKYPSPFEDSAEVVVKDPGLSSSSQERLRRRDQKKLASSLNLNNAGNYGEKKKRVSTPTTTFGTTAGAASSIYSSITSAASATSPIIRETTTSFSPSTTTKKDKNRRKGKSGFRPSPQIHSFEEPVTGFKSYITILPPVTTLSGDENSNETKERGKKSLFSKFQAVESRHPPYEAGFKPVSQYTYAVGKGMPAASTTTETLYFDLIREASSKAPGTAWSEPDLTAFSEDSKRENRQFVTTSDGLTVTPVINNGKSNYGYTTLSSTSSTDSFIKAGWKVKDHGVTGGGDDGKRQLTTSASSERVESWKYPELSGGKLDTRIYFGNGKFFGPPNCDKFHRFGFCPMNSGYPTDQVEKIASRCSALLSHLIAPLPKADVRYDVIVAKNGSMLKGRSAAPSGWSWKSFAGKPVCDTKEIKVVPGWAKNEQGEWLVILQTKAWKQEAQITLCTPQGTHNTCSSKNKGSCTPNRIKCVQRFTAQRLAVLDPENTDRCPVLRSVFLPSACVCLYDDSSSRSRSSSSEEFNANHIKSSKSSKKGSKGKKGSKKSSSKSNSSSKGSARTARSGSGVTSSSSEELDTAASSNSGSKTKQSAAETFSEKKHTKNQEDDNVSSPEEVETIAASDDDDSEPQAKPLISTQTPTNAHTSPPSPNEDESVSQNELDNDNADSSNEAGNNSTIAITTSPNDNDDDSNDNENRVTTTLTPTDEESSGSEEKEDADVEVEKKE